MLFVFVRTILVCVTQKTQKSALVSFGSAMFATTIYPLVMHVWNCIQGAVNHELSCGCAIRVMAFFSAFLVAHKVYYTPESRNKFLPPHDHQWIGFLLCAGIWIACENPGPHPVADLLITLISVVIGLIYALCNGQKIGSNVEFLVTVLTILALLWCLLICHIGIAKSKEEFTFAVLTTCVFFHGGHYLHELATQEDSLE